MDKEIVAPGDVIGVAEEYLPGENVEVDTDGKLRAQVMGIVVRNERDHVVSVKPLRSSNSLLRVNDVVYGRVIAIPNDRVVIVKIIGVENNGGKMALKDDVTGIIPPSQLLNGKSSNASEILGIGDIIRARVISRDPPYTLTLRDAQLGVVYARCPRCGHELKLKGNDLLQCPNCGAVVRRKVSLIEYWI
ncbi:RNA binding S1 domain protein [Vulcanisaeta moutnovskia 768-28]|uniref:Exosome complex component Csl4 n=1 Tax=Vulcanisaeta moutnovskia (strain 768-28) TaxID=985053 RepID=F0QX19_VULM7|nr:exosome complex RNA-binding protein Csl4 [Vulcanisaeta moutnovskia]ADY02308.1 RNA binding S1 domain protein [Vulcanisaeta moutnovskia 768-28]